MMAPKQRGHKHGSDYKSNYHVLEGISTSFHVASCMQPSLTVKHGVEIRAHCSQHHPVSLNGIDAYLEHDITQLKQKKCKVPI